MGHKTVLATGVLSYDLLPDGSILYSNGGAIFRREPDGNVQRVSRAAHNEKVVAVSE